MLLGVTILVKPISGKRPGDRQSDIFGHLENVYKLYLPLQGFEPRTIGLHLLAYRAGYAW